MRHAITAISLLLLAGCGQRGGALYADEAVAVEMIAPSAPGAVAGPPSAQPSLAAPQVAYVYRYGLGLPVDRARALLARHEQTCVQAGPGLCQVIASESAREGGDALNARLEIRATPAWLARFRAGLTGDAASAGGKVVSSSTESEDLTRNLIDTEARLRAQTTLRDRLQQLLATRTGDLEQLLKVESELARVQGEIDTVQSTLAVLRTRVAMSRLEIRYDSRAVLAGDGAFAPLTDALTGALRIFMQSLAVLVTLVAVTLPFAVIGGLAVWLGLKGRRKLKARTASRKAMQVGPADVP